MAETYTLNVAGLTRELTICKVNDHMDIAAFIMLGDTELTVAAAAELLKKCPEFDILLTAEAKGIPLAHEMSRQSGKPYVCARKGIKLYMKEPVVVEDQSITTAGKQKLVIDRKELDKMNGKRVLVVDDVISTGGSLKALDALAEQTKCTIVGQAAVLAEGDAAERKDIIFLEPALPLLRRCAGGGVGVRLFAASMAFAAACGNFCLRAPCRCAGPKAPETGRHSAAGRGRAGPGGGAAHPRPAERPADRL